MLLPIINNTVIGSSSTNKLTTSVNWLTNVLQKAASKTTYSTSLWYILDVEQVAMQTTNVGESTFVFFPFLKKPLSIDLNEFSPVRVNVCSYEA